MSPTLRFTHLGLLAIAAFGVVAVPLGVFGLFHWYVLFPAWATVAGALFAIAPDQPFVPRAGIPATLTALGVIVVVSGLNVAFPTEHFATNRDPGVYAVSGLWLEREGSILVDPPPDLLHEPHGLWPAGGGFYDLRDDGKLAPQFAHLTHTALGAAAIIGGETLLVRANALIGAFALLVFFVLAQQIIRPWPAVLATSLLAISLPQMYFSRGPYSEPLAQLLLLGALAVLVARPDRTRPGHGLLVGLLLGALISSRIDAALVLVALIGVLAVWWTDHLHADRRWVAWAAAGTVVTGGIGIVNLVRLNPEYLTDHWDQLSNALVLGVVVAIGSAACLVARRARESAGDLLRQRARSLGMAGAGLTVVGFASLLFVRPRIQRAAAGPSNLIIEWAQQRQGLPVDGTRLYSEETTWWFQWYFGWPTMLLAILGAALVVWWTVNRWSWSTFAVVATLGIPTALYLVRPSITPDQIWAMRRFLPTGLPLFALLAAMGAQQVHEWLARRDSISGRTGIAAGLGALALVPVALVSGPFWNLSEHRLPRTALDSLCEAIDDRTVVLDGHANLGVHLIQPLAIRCGVDAVRIDPERMPEVGALVEGFGQVVVISTRDDLATAAPPLELDRFVEFEERQLERVVRGAPGGTEQPPGTLTTYFVYVFDSG